MEGGETQSSARAQRHRPFHVLIRASQCLFQVISIYLPCFYLWFKDRVSVRQVAVGEESQLAPDRGNCIFTRTIATLPHLCFLYASVHSTKPLPVFTFNFAELMIEFHQAVVCLTYVQEVAGSSLGWGKNYRDLMTP